MRFAFAAVVANERVKRQLKHRFKTPVQTPGRNIMPVSKFLPLKLATGAAIALCVAAITPAAHAWECASLPSHSELKNALIHAQSQMNGGFGLEMWGTIVDRDGQVCAVAFTGFGAGARGSRGPGGSA